VDPRYWGDIGTGLIWADMTGTDEGWFRIKFCEIDQRIILVRCPRRFGNGQWYFVCPTLNERVSVLWMPPGAKRFRSRRAWGRQVAYTSQFMSPTDRAWRAKSKINSRLCALGGFDPDDWEFPPKPKGMRWRTYRGYEYRFDRQEDAIARAHRCPILVAKVDRLTRSVAFLSRLLEAGWMSDLRTCL
jgi:hypothetical protein